MFVTLALRWSRQDGPEFEASLDYIVRFCMKKKERKRRRRKHVIISPTFDSYVNLRTNFFIKNLKFEGLV